MQDGWSALMLACDRGHLDVVKELIQAKAAVNSCDPVCYSMCLCLLTSMHMQESTYTVYTCMLCVHVTCDIVYKHMLTQAT